GGGGRVFVGVAPLVTNPANPTPPEAGGHRRGLKRRGGRLCYGKSANVMTSDLLSRRDWLGFGAGAATMAFSGLLGELACQAAAAPHRKRACILLWMAGGPAQTDTFDLKPGHKNGGPFREIATAAPRLRFCEL